MCQASTIFVQHMLLQKTTKKTPYTSGFFFKKKASVYAQIDSIPLIFFSSV